MHMCTCACACTCTCACACRDTKPLRSLRKVPSKSPFAKSLRSARARPVPPPHAPPRRPRPERRGCGWRPRPTTPSALARPLRPPRRTSHRLGATNRTPHSHTHKTTKQKSKNPARARRERITDQSSDPISCTTLTRENDADLCAPQCTQTTHSWWTLRGYERRQNATSRLVDGRRPTVQVHVNMHKGADSGQRPGLVARGNWEEPDLVRSAGGAEPGYA